LVSTLSKSRAALCFGGRHEFRKVLCQRIISYENEAHIVDKFCNFLKFLDIEISSDTKQLVGLEEDSEARGKLLALLEKRKVDVDKDLLVVVNVNAGEMSNIRKWPAEYYQKVLSAEACGLPNVSFFGPESPLVYGHAGDENHTFYSNLPCSPCINVYTNKDTRCKDNVCLKLIKPEKVIKVLQEKYFDR